MGASQVALVVKNLPANAGYASSIPGLGRSPGGGHANPLQYSYLKNPMDKGACWATYSLGSREELTQLSMSTHACMHTHTHTHTHTHIHPGISGQEPQKRFCSETILGWTVCSSSLEGPVGLHTVAHSSDYSHKPPSYWLFLLLLSLSLAPHFHSLTLKNE